MLAGSRSAWRSLFGAAALGLLLGCERPKVAARPVAVVVSGDTAGWLMPCGCTSNQSGGLPRRGSYLAELGKDAEVVYLDAGGAAGGASPYHKEKFEAILRGEKRMGVVAHNVGSSEMALGAAYLRALPAKTGVTLVCANVTDEAGREIAPALVSAKAGGRTIAVIGVVSPKYAQAGLKVGDARQGALTAIEKSGKGHDAVVVLAYVPEDELAALAAALPEVDAVIGGPTGQAIAPKLVGPVLSGAATNKGKFLVKLDAAPAHSPWSGQVVEMGPTIADAPDQSANVKDYLARLGERAFSAEESGLVAALPAGTPADFRVAGTAACVACHGADHKTWAGSKHAHAFDTLRPKGFHVDSYCQSCHTTGFALPGGFAGLSASPDKLLAVGCESCHGPSAAHAKAPARRTAWAPADQCVRCHDHENSPTFDYKNYWPRIAHGKPATIGEAK